jgi:membrane protease YdiL (CAAX protease family)
MEVVKIVAATVFLEIASHYLFSHKKFEWKIRTLTVVIPIIQEIFFRGFIQGGIRFVQDGWNDYVVKRELTQNEIMIQKTWRIHLTALIYGAAHLRNSNSDYYAKYAQGIWFYLRGVSYGYLNEKYRTLSANILAHGISNISLLSTAIYARAALPIALLIDPVVYFLGTRSNLLDQTLDQFKVTLSNFYTHFFVQRSQNLS